MRQALAFRRQSMFFVRAHLAERAIEAVGPEQRIVAEAFVAARRPHATPSTRPSNSSDMAVGPGETQRGNEMRAPLLGRACAALDQQRLDPCSWRHGNPCRVRPSAPNGCRARRRAHRPPDRNRRRTPRLPVAFAAAIALMRALAAKVLPVSSARQPEFAGRLRRDAERRQQLAHFRSLPGLWVAITTGPVSFLASTLSPPSSASPPVSRCPCARAPAAPGTVPR